MPASGPGVNAVLRALGASETDAIPACNQVVLIDGGSGAGKTTFAADLVRLWPRAQLVHLDDIYPGWAGLEAASAHLHRYVLAPLAAGRRARWQRWDWIANAVSDWVDVDAGSPLVVEGSGALSRVNRGCASLGVWIELDPAIRKRRALARDGDSYTARWEQWADQELAFATRENPRGLADLEIDGTTFDVSLDHRSRGIATMGA